MLQYVRRFEIFLEDLKFKCHFKEVRSGHARVLSSLSLRNYLWSASTHTYLNDWISMQPESAMISELHKPQKDFHGSFIPTPQGATNFPLHWLPHFSSSGTARAVRDESEIAMTNANELLLISPRRNAFSLSVALRRKKFPRLAHFRFSPRHPIYCVYTWSEYIGVGKGGVWAAVSARRTIRGRGMFLGHAARAFAEPAVEFIAPR